MIDLEIIVGDAADVTSVMPIMGAAFDPAFGEAWRQDQCTTILTLPGTAIFIAKVQGAPCGFALVRSVLEEMEILLIAVDPAIQRKKIGQQLLERITHFARDNEVQKIFLEVREDNPAVHFYKSQNFSQIGYRPAYYSGIDGIKRGACTYAKILL
jgi:[ribosomal protein S18]-alanine N-acetyltransferase